MKIFKSTDNNSFRDTILKISSLAYISIISSLIASFVFILLLWLRYDIIYSSYDGLITFAYYICLFSIFHFGIAIIIGLPVFYLQRLMPKLVDRTGIPYISELSGFLGIISYYVLFPPLFRLRHKAIKFSHEVLPIIVGILVLILFLVGIVFLFRKIKNQHFLNREKPKIASLVCLFLAILGIVLINKIYPDTYTFSYHYRDYSPLKLKTETADADNQVLEQRVKNIILVTYDSLRPDHLSFFDYPRQTSPFLDEIMSKSASFSNVTVSHPLTAPSFASLFTGSYPWFHGVWAPFTVLPDNMVTVAEELKDHGYHNYAVVANVNVEPTFNYDQGFDKYFSALTRENDDKRNTDPVSLTDTALDMINQGLESPFFLWVHYLDPHTPYDADNPYVKNYINDPLYKKDSEPANYRKKIYGYGTTPSAKKVADFIARYDGEIRYQDDQFKRLFNALKERGHLENSLFIFTSDHGEYFGHHGYYFSHGASPYRELQVPLFWYSPGLIPPQRSDQPVELIDVVPTMLSLAGIKSTNMNLSGVDLSDYLTKEPGKTEFPRTYAMGTAYVTDRGRSTGQPQFFILRSKEWELIVNKLDHIKRIKSFRHLMEFPTLFFKVRMYEFRGQGVELYNMHKDPTERENLALEHPEVVDSMLNALGEKLFIYAKPGDIQRRLQKEDLDKATIEELKNLGYIN